ncbi:glycosyltransferase family 32 protein [Hallella absiana]|uniref:glycosyltransferase family 32 protein n=1 Tax=Hallella absiana TaxID=2925336 RepID=UPI0021C6FC5D|nr:glycosyltransferase [Hallella absiana]
MQANNKDTIPRILHFCWYGGGKGNYVVRKCVSSFHKSGNGMVIKKWDESNFDDNNNSYVKEAFRQKKWAFVSDYIRLLSLYNYGGIYVDSDVEFKKAIPNILYSYDLVLCYEYDDVISTAFIMAKPHHPFVKELLDYYSKLTFMGGGVTNNGIFTHAAIDFFPDFTLNGLFHEFSSNCVIFPRYYFISPTYKKDGGYSVHHNLGSWHGNNYRHFGFLRPAFKFARFYCKPIYVWWQEKVNKKMITNHAAFYKIYRKYINN